MVNSKNLATAMVVVVGMGTIAAYMSANGLSSKDITLNDACWAANADPMFGDGSLNATCDMIVSENIEWDTKIPCLAAFKPTEYFFTHRDLFGIDTLGRNTKGTQATVDHMKANENVDLDICEELVDDEDYSTFMADTDAWVEAHSEEREMLAFWGVWVPFTNYKACSLNLIFLLGGSDSAECSIEDGQCSGWHNKDLSSKWKMNRGCNRHDMCLEGRGSYKDPSYCCDNMLRAASKSCRNFGGGGWSCGWRGCKKSCSDNRTVGLLTYWAMPSAGHDDSGCSNGGKNYWP
jgi:hypothetical protein